MCKIANRRAGRDDGRGRRPVLAQARLHVAAEEDLFGAPRDHSQDDDRAEQVGSGGALQQPADEHDRLTLAQPEHDRQRIERLAQREQADDHHRERRPGLPARPQPKPGRRERLDHEDERQEQTGRCREAAGQEPGQRAQQCRLGHVGVHRVQRLDGDAGRGEDAGDRCCVGREDVPGAAGTLVHAVRLEQPLSRAARAGVRPAPPRGPGGRSWPRRTDARRSAGPAAARRPRVRTAAPAPADPDR